MVYIEQKDIKNTERKYGIPELRETTFAMPEAEFSMVKASQVNGRAHDVTVFIFKDDCFIFNAKHWYPEGMSRAPSGAAKPGETIEEGALREVYEETGCNIKLLKYLLRIKCRFTCGEEYIDWTSHIFSGEYINGDLQPIDTIEIREVVIVHPSEIPDIKKMMKSIDSGGLQYRVYLTDEVMWILFPV
ncbi:MAG: NUDIX hydrolase [candidate division Zixibacteria bacterium]|nr:NUDIX hydrolase [candidate division Zixibacteria bacterium]